MWESWPAACRIWSLLVTESRLWHARYANFLWVELRWVLPISAARFQDNTILCKRFQIMYLFARPNSKGVNSPSFHPYSVIYTWVIKLNMTFLSPFLPSYPPSIYSSSAQSWLLRPTHTIRRPCQYMYPITFKPFCFSSLPDAKQPAAPVTTGSIQCHTYTIHQKREERKKGKWIASKNHKKNPK